MIDLVLLWALIIAFAVIAYVVLDGFDLGVGILFPFLEKGRQRDHAMTSVAPVWDGNETWLVLGGGGLFAAFPLAYAILMPALYAPIIAMLLGLILRGVAFEFRWRTVRGRFLWDWAFAGGSGVAALAQGVALGAIVQGIPVEGRAYGGGWLDWLTPFSVATGVALIAGYGLLGATWLVMKTEGGLQERAWHLATPLALATVAAIGLVSLWTPFLEPLYFERWLAWPAVLYTAPVPLAVAAATFLLLRGLARREERSPFLAALALFVLSYVGLGISFYPFIVPPSVSIWQAASPAPTLLFMLVGTAILVPLIIAYTAYAYWVFRGKVDPEGGYH